MLNRFFRRIRASVDLFIRTHIVADEKDLWPEFSAMELHELEMDWHRREAARR